MSKEKEIVTLHSMFDKVDKLKQHKRKVDLLKEYRKNFAFVTVIQGSFDNNIKLPFPPGPPPYEAKKDPVELNIKMFRFQPCFDKNRHQWAREKWFIQILEKIDAKDAEIVIAMKDKKLTELYPTITKELIQEAMPGLVK
mgnify:CR=1 FL=1|tara:strand:+ start:54 stop:473 length:420 start_codon:yes stop_codon:yes gene_type:complete